MKKVIRKNGAIRIIVVFLLIILAIVAVIVIYNTIRSLLTEESEGGVIGTEEELSKGIYEYEYDKLPKDGPPKIEEIIGAGTASTETVGELTGILKPTQIMTKPFFNYGCYKEKLGVELISCGDFSCSSSWSLGRGWLISDETVKGRVGTLKQEVKIQSGKRYKISYRIVSWEAYRGGGYLQLILGGKRGKRITSASPGEVITEEISFEGIGGNLNYGSLDYITSNKIVFEAGYNTRGGLSFTIDDVSVREVKKIVEIERNITKIPDSADEYKVDLIIDVDETLNIDSFFVIEYPPEKWEILEAKDAKISDDKVGWVFSGLLENKVKDQIISYKIKSKSSEGMFRGYWQAYLGIYKMCEDVIYGDQGDFNFKAGGCIDNYGAYCFEDKLYYYDSCGNKGELKENCEYCVGPEFDIKYPFYSACSDKKDCYDSDGLNSNKKGFIITKDYFRDYFKYYDKCETEMLVEYFCEEKMVPAKSYEMITCNCEKGRCVA